MKAHTLIGTLAVLHLAATSTHGAIVVDERTQEFEAAVGGFLADDDDNGVFDRALSGGFGTGGGHSWMGSAEYQGSYEFDLEALGSQLPANEDIVSVYIRAEISVVGAISTTPNIRGILGGYSGDGAFGLADANQGSQIGTFWIWNHNLVSYPYEDPMIDVTSFFLSSRAAGDQYIGFNFRPSSVPSGSVTNNYSAPRLEVTWSVPEPSAALLVTFGGMVALLGRRRSN